MRISLAQEGDEVVFCFLAEEEDIEHLRASKIGMSNTEARIKLGGVNLEDIHPDLIGLSIILMCHQFVGEKLHFPMDVSNEFLEGSNGVLSKYNIIANSNRSIGQFEPPRGARPGLAFSGGADSTAALAVMPGDTVPVFMNRPMREGSMYDSDAPLRSCEKLREIGYDVKVIDCDLEFLREPIGFPSDLAHAIPLILLAGEVGIDSIAFGTILESAYGIGHKRFIDYPNGSHKKFYGTLFSSAGLEISLPVAGVSEVGTALIIAGSPLGSLAQSCIRGKMDNPCLRCWKCFRKELLTMALFPSKEVDLRNMMRNSSEVQIRLSAYPISHENVVNYSIKRIGTKKYPFLRPLRDRLDKGQDLSLLGHWYSPSKCLIPERSRMSIIEKILKFIPPMNSEHEEFLENWDMGDFLLSEKTVKSHSDLTSYWQEL